MAMLKLVQSAIGIGCFRMWCCRKESGVGKLVCVSVHPLMYAVSVISFCHFTVSQGMTDIQSWAQF
jgi:hypothetical protein